MCSGKVGGSRRPPTGCPIHVVSKYDTAPGDNPVKSNMFRRFESWIVFRDLLGTFLTWVEILDIVPFCVTGHALFARLRENREIVSRLLKVVET